MSGGGKNKSITVGYRYFFSIHMGLCRGAIDELHMVKVGDRLALTTAVANNASVVIDQPDLFGGEKAEGGVVGQLDVLMGGEQQVASEREFTPEITGMFDRLVDPMAFASDIMSGIHGSVLPAFRGVTTLLFDGMIAALNPYPKPWKFRVRRILKGWDGDVWYESKAIIQASPKVRAMNPAHIIYQIETDRNWGRGHPAERLDLASFQAAADTLYAEGLGLCLKWTGQDSIKNFQQVVIDHIGATRFVSRKTGLITLRLIRAEDDLENLPVYTYNSGLLSIEEESQAVSDSAPNQIIVKWVDPTTDEKRTAGAQNVGAIQATRAVYSQTVNYPGAPTHTLASRLAQRDLEARQGIRRFRLKLDRRGQKEEPSGLIRISAPDRGIDNVVLRIGRIDYGTLADGEIKIVALEDVFGLPSTTYSVEQESTWQAPVLDPQPASQQALLEVPYRDLTQQLSGYDLEALEDDAGYVAVMGGRPNSMSINYSLYTRVGSDEYEERGTGDWVPTCVLAADAGYGDDTFHIANSVDLGIVVAGSVAVINDEMFRVDSVNVLDSIISVSRGCVDSLPGLHVIGDRIWFYSDYAGYDSREYVSGGDVDAKLLTRTSAGELDISLAASASLVLDQRHARPYPPANIRIGGSLFPEAFGGDLLVEWSHRDRILQNDVVVPWTDGDIGPEPGTTYTLTIYDEDGVLARTETGLTGNSYTWVDELADTGRINSQVRITLRSERDGLESKDTFDYTVLRAGYGLHYGKYYGGGY